MTHRQIETFRAVMDTGRITTAAELLNMTQPSASRLIADLEHAVGFQLFRREGRLVVSTPEAQALYEEVERSFVGMAEIARAVEDIRDYRRGSLMIAAMPALGLQFLPALIARFVALEPGISVSLRIRSSQAVLRHVSSQQFDIGFAAIEIKHPAVIRVPLVTAPMLAVLPPGHPLCRKAVLRPEDFHEQPFIALGSEISTRSEIDAFLALGKARPVLVAEAQLSFAICELVASGAGVSIVEPVTAAQFRRAGRVATLPLIPEQPFRYDVLRPALREPSLVTRRFLDLLHETMGSGIFD